VDFVKKVPQAPLLDHLLSAQIVKSDPALQRILNPVAPHDTVETGDFLREFINFPGKSTS